MQEITLVLGRIACLVQLDAAGSVDQARIVPRGEAVGAEAPRIFERHAEFYLAVTEHVGIGRAPGTVLGEERLEHPRAVLGGEAHAVQGNSEPLGDGTCVLEVLGGGAPDVVRRLVPVAHEEPLYLEALLLEEQRRDRGVDAAGERDDDAGGGGA